MTPRGGFARDREFGLFDEAGVVNGKREPAVHALRVTYDSAVTRAAFASTHTGDRFAFDLDDDPRELERWLARHFGRPVAVRREPDGGFPDDTAAPGPTVLSTATLQTVASWFPGLDVAGMRSRLRANIEIGGVDAFWEDRLYGSAGTPAPFRVGEALLEGTNPCQRCIVPARDPETGLTIAAFAKRVAERRAATLPAWADASRFNHYYRLAVNTRPATPQAGRTVRSGDAVWRNATDERAHAG